jgi:hypothetical protein
MDSGVAPWSAYTGPVSVLVPVMSANATAIRYKEAKIPVGEDGRTQPFVSECMGILRLPTAFSPPRGMVGVSTSGPRLANNWGDCLFRCKHQNTKQVELRLGTFLGDNRPEVCFKRVLAH